MLTWAEDWELGHTPVTMGRAQWLTVPFIQAMHVVKSTRNQQRREAVARREKKVG